MFGDFTALTCATSASGFARINNYTFRRSLVEWNECVVNMRWDVSLALSKHKSDKSNLFYTKLKDNIVEMKGKPHLYLLWACLGAASAHMSIYYASLSKIDRNRCSLAIHRMNVFSLFHPKKQITCLRHCWYSANNMTLSGFRSIFRTLIQFILFILCCLHSSKSCTWNHKQAWQCQM